MPKRKLHEFIDNIEHKHCGSCDQWVEVDQFHNDARAWDKRQSCCKPCKKKKSKQRHDKNKQARKKKYDKQRHKVILEKLQKARDEAPIGFLVCLNSSCTVKGLQHMDQFINAYVRNNKPTSHCKTCHNKKKEAHKKSYAPCQKVWDDWRKTHRCVKCMNDKNYEHNPLLIEADHLRGKVTHCSNVSYWCHSKRGPRALKAELMKCQALCRFHHRIVTQQRDSNKGKIKKQKSKLRKRTVINAEKYRRGCCLRCKRVLKKGEECAFDFDHRDASTKFKYRGKTMSPSKFVRLPNALFDSQWPLEQAKCDLLCANCHKLKNNRDGYKN